MINLDDVKKQAQWEIDIERFEEAVKKEKAKIKSKKLRFPWRLRFINLNKVSK